MKKILRTIERVRSQRCEYLGKMQQADFQCTLGSYLKIKEYGKENLNDLEISAMRGNIFWVHFMFSHPLYLLQFNVINKVPESRKEIKVGWRHLEGNFTRESEGTAQEKHTAPEKVGQKLKLFSLFSLLIRVLLGTTSSWKYR